MTPSQRTELERKAKAATPGKRGWFGNANHQQLYLATINQGRRFIMQFARWGMRGSQPRFQTDGRMVDASTLLEFEVCDAIGTEAAKKNDACYRLDISGIDHPDAKFMAACDPETILALISALTEAERRVEAARNAALEEAAGWHETMGRASRSQYAKDFNLVSANAIRALKTPQT